MSISPSRWILVKQSWRAVLLPKTLLGPPDWGQTISPAAHLCLCLALSLEDTASFPDCYRTVVLKVRSLTSSCQQCQNLLGMRQFSG